MTVKETIDYANLLAYVMGKAEMHLQELKFPDQKEALEKRKEALEVIWRNVEVGPWWKLADGIVDVLLVPKIVEEAFLKGKNEVHKEQERSRHYGPTPGQIASMWFVFGMSAGLMLTGIMNAIFLSVGK